MYKQKKKKVYECNKKKNYTKRTKRFQKSTSGNVNDMRKYFTSEKKFDNEKYIGKITVCTERKSISTIEEIVLLNATT